MARPGLDRNSKYRLLLRKLDEPEAHVRGYLECGWDSVYETGNPVIGDAATVEATFKFVGEPGKLCKALLECGGEGRAGFIEEVPDRPGIFQIHDLYDHCPDYVLTRSKFEAERKVEKNCANCDGPFRSKDKRAKYCTDACRTAAYRKRDGLVTQGDTEQRNVMDCDGPPAPAPAPAPAPKKKKNRYETLTQLPESMDTPDVRVALDRWVAYRAQRKPALTEASIAAIPEQWRERGPTRFVQAVNNSIAQGYQGIYEGNNDGANNQRGETSSARVKPTNGKYAGIKVLGNGNTKATNLTCSQTAEELDSGRSSKTTPRSV